MALGDVSQPGRDHGFRTSSDYWGGRIRRRAVWPTSGMQSFPHLPTMHRNIAIDIKTESYSIAVDRQHRDLELAFEASEPPIMTASWFFLDKTNMEDLLFLSRRISSVHSRSTHPPARYRRARTSGPSCRS